MVTIEGFRRPFSRPLMYCWLNPDSSANFSWVRPFLSRIRFTLRPTSARISMRGSQPIMRVEFINFSIRQALTAAPRSSRRPLKQSRCFHAEDTGEFVDRVDAGGVDATLKRTYVSPIDAGVVGERLLGQPPFQSEPPQIACKDLSYVHAREGNALRRISPRSILDNMSSRTAVMADMAPIHSPARARASLRSRLEAAA